MSACSFIPAPPLLSIKHTTGFNNGSTLNGQYSAFPPGDNLVGFYKYEACSTYNSSQMVTANQSIPSTPGSGSIPSVAVTGLFADTMYCYQVSRHICAFPWPPCIRAIRAWIRSSTYAHISLLSSSPHYTYRRA